MPGLRPDVDPEGLQEFSVVFTDRSLNHMSARFQQAMRDISGMLREVYNGSAVALVPGGGSYAMESVARQFGQGRALIVRNGWLAGAAAAAGARSGAAFGETRTAWENAGPARAPPTTSTARRRLSLRVRIVLSLPGRYGRPAALRSPEGTPGAAATRRPRVPSIVRDDLWLPAPGWPNSGTVSVILSSPAGRVCDKKTD